MNHIRPAALALLAFVLTACGQQNDAGVHQPQTATAAPATAASQPVESRSRRDDGPVYDGKTY